MAASDVIPESQVFWKLAVPLAAAQVAQFAVGFVDTIVMDHLDTASLAAGGRDRAKPFARRSHRSNPRRRSASDDECA